MSCASKPASPRPVILGGLGWVKTMTYVGLAVGLSTTAGMLFGSVA